MKVTKKSRKVAVDWPQLYEQRRARLLKLLAQNAPAQLIDREMQMLLAAGARGELRAIRGWLWQWVTDQAGSNWFAVRWFWYERVRRWERDRIEEKLLGGIS